MSVTLWNPPINGIRFELDPSWGKGENDIPSGFTYSRWRETKATESGRYFLPELLSGSDYSGSLVERSNAAAWRRDFADGESVWWAEVYGGHGTFGIAIDLEFVSDVAAETAETAREFLNHLDTYPLADEDLHSEMEHEAEGKAWEQWGLHDFVRALQPRLEKLWEARRAEMLAERDRYGFLPLDADPDVDCPDLSDADKGEVTELFYVVSDRIGEYWINEQGDSMYVDVARVCKAVSDDEILGLTEVEVENKGEDDEEKHLDS